MASLAERNSTDLLQTQTFFSFKSPYLDRTLRSVRYCLSSYFAARLDKTAPPSSGVLVKGSALLCSSTVTYRGVVFQQQTASVSLYNFYKLALHADMSCVLYAVRTASLYIPQISFFSNGITDKKNQEFGRNQEACLYVADLLTCIIFYRNNVIMVYFHEKIHEGKINSVC